jgi:hypothetical protein
MNKTMFWVGIVFIIIATILLLGNFMGDSAFPVVLGLLGIISIGSSQYKPMKQKKK